MTLNMLFLTALANPSGFPSMSTPSNTCSAPPNLASNRSRASASSSARVLRGGGGVGGDVGEEVEMEVAGEGEGEWEDWQKAGRREKDGQRNASGGSTHGS